MSRRIPLVPTLLVLLAVAAMIGLGVWQWQRKGEKEAFVAAAAANLHRPSMSFPKTGPVEDAVLFRPSALTCLRVTGWTVQAGRDAQGGSGFGYIAQCVTGAEGQGALVLLGVGARPDLKPAWRGGRVEGWISREPEHSSLLGRLTGPPTVLRPMLVAKRSVAGLRAPSRPSALDIPNNHLAYAIQWFLFAAIALVIYGLALRRRTPGGDS